MNKVLLGASAVALAGGITLVQNVEEADAYCLPNYYVTRVNLNLRSAPSKEDGLIYTTIPAQELVEVEEYNKDYTWARVSWGHRTGWVYAKYIKVYEDGLDSSHYTKVRLNLRKKPTTTEYNIIRTLPKNTKVIILKQKNDWLYVKPLDGIGYRGWVSSQYVK